MNTYEISETVKTATWKKASLEFGYKCSNCGNKEEYGFPARSIVLGNFCSNCGFRMENPKKIEVKYDVD